MYFEFFNTKCSFCNEEEQDCILYSEETLTSSKTFVCGGCLAFDVPSLINKEIGEE